MKRRIVAAILAISIIAWSVIVLARTPAQSEDVVSHLPVIRKPVPTPTSTSTPTNTPTPTVSPTPTQTPSPTPTAIPTNTPTPTATTAPDVIVESSNIFVPYDASSNWYLVGEVRNNTDSNVRFVRINATLRDSAGNVVDSDYSYSMIDVLTPQMESPFRIIFTDPPEWSTYELNVTWDETSEQPYPLQILNHTTYFDSYDAYHAAGEIQNQYDENRDFVAAYLTLYDASGEVIGAEYTYTNPDELTPGQTASFDAEVYFWKGKPDRSLVQDYRLQVYDD